MVPLSRYDDPAILDRFLQVMRGNSQSAKTETHFVKNLSELDPQGPEFSLTVVADKEVENEPYETRTSPHGVQSSYGQEPARKRPLTPTQHRLLVGKKPGIERLTENKLAEWSKQTDGYINNVVDQFRMSRDRNLTQDFVAGDHVPTCGFHVAPSSRGGSSSPSDEDQESNPDMSDANGMPVTPGADGSQDDMPIQSPGQKEQWQEESPDTSPCSTPAADSSFKKDNQQHGVDYSIRMRTNDSPRVVPIHSFTGAQIVQTLGNVKGPREAVAAVKDNPLPTPTPNLPGHSTAREEDGGEQVAPVMAKACGSYTSGSRNHSPAVVVTASTDTDDSVEGDDDEDEDDEGDQEDRENLVHFKSWGTPAARNKPKSRPRTIILTGLPYGADFTLVQSLIHGGAIECMRLVTPNPARTTISAHVTFTSADACDRYYDKNHKGIDVHHQGRKWSVLVLKKTQVDVISGMMQGYLDCGATRVVKVSGADDDWGIVALNKLAEGKPIATRQVEFVQDTYRNGIRTILFRFANITHAVHFKGYLIRNDDWYGCHVEFAEDPCEKAAGIHND
ncbi:hypothetical protein AYL99_00119 [Fonsecaea erecta]|uniref:RRM domain-containing protein n=1 Tax=Fonsecaea erecta TaxID=1367422 RepID=A0A178ZWS5_9EURO|nr:hypothetical protein AYL99_00119 [Fonsecaea erecta]OAP64147.1 hypothetical protein AYL99_00119 [Fonsecaea erecta]